VQRRVAAMRYRRPFRVAPSRTAATRLRAVHGRLALAPVVPGVVEDQHMLPGSYPSGDSMRNLCHRDNALTRISRDTASLGDSRVAFICA